MAKRGRSFSGFARKPPQIPIVDETHAIVGWTDQQPKVIGCSVLHREAEALLGCRVGCTFIELANEDDIARAGAPPGWRGKWRCIALSPDGTHTVPIGVTLSKSDQHIS